MGALACAAASLYAGNWLRAGAGELDAAGAGANAAAIVLEDFERSDVASDWQTVNDDVMGGRSRGGPVFHDGVLRFSGVTNTDGGGFSSIRTRAGAFDLSGSSGILVRVRGDGRTYKLSLRTDARYRNWPIAFRADFKTEKDQWQKIYLPFSAFEPSFRGRTFADPPTLDRTRIQAVGLMIYDKQDGPFALEVDWIHAVDRAP
jgi:monofunctional biosynthetic peptidoglycan transglycosylase